MDDQTAVETKEQDKAKEVEKAAETNKQEKTVPQSRMDEVNAENKTLKEQNELLRQNAALINANVQSASAANAKPFNIYKEVGLDPDDPSDIPNQEQTRKINEYFQRQNQQLLSQIQFKIEHPDYNQIVGTAEQIQMGQFAEPLTKAIKANPTLMATIQNSADPMRAAYAIGKMQAEKIEKGDDTGTTKTEAAAAIDEAVQNANKVKTSANAQGGEGLSEEGRVANMTDADFIKAFNQAGGDL